MIGLIMAAVHYVQGTVLLRVTIILCCRYYYNLYFIDGTRRLSNLSKIVIPTLKTFNDNILSRASP